MQVFKAYFGIIRKNLGQMSIYLGVFLGLSIMFANLGVGSVISEFAESKPPVAVFIEDDSVLAQGFKDYLAGETTIVPIKDNENALRDALFFREVVYIIRVPEGFGDRFVSGENRSSNAEWSRIRSMQRILTGWWTAISHLPKGI